MSERYISLARYNTWANARVFAAAEALSDGDYRADRGAFFKSVHGTLNHLLAADRIWMRRFTGEGEAPVALDAILFDDLAPLHRARTMEDARIEAYVRRLDAEALRGVFSYRAVSVPQRFEMGLAPALDHVFNHQTHHRGQVHALLTGLRGAAPSLDLVAFQREAGLGGVRVLPDDAA